MAYDKNIALALRLIDKFGRGIVLSKAADIKADPTKPWKGTGVVNDEWFESGKGVFLPATGDDLGTLVTDDNLLKQVSQVVLVAPFAARRLDSATTLKDAKGTFGIKWCKVLEPGDQVVLYAFGVSQ